LSRYASARFEIAQLNEFLNLKNVRVIGANRLNDYQLVLYLEGDGLPDYHEVDPSTNFNPVSIYIELDSLKASEAPQAASQDDPINE
jgi:hypothetical protein